MSKNRIPARPALLVLAGWVLVSAAVEAAADEPFFTFTRTRIFTPLGMTDTTPDSATAPIAQAFAEPAASPKGK